MAQIIGSDRKGGVNVDLNIVPFIDLMSCLTAFLLVAAVWVNTANLKNEPAGRGRETVGEEHPKLSVLLEYDQMIVTETRTGETRQVAAFDWAHLETALHELQPSGETPHVEIAADSSNAHPIPYQVLIAAMDTTVRAGFPDVGVTDSASLSR